MVEVNLLSIFLTILPNLGGIAGAFVVTKNIKPWYDTLKKPNIRPPKWAFAPIWTTLYTLMGYASYMVYRDGGGLNGPAKLPLIVYAVNLIANWLWSPIFFGKKDITLALVEMQLGNITALGMAYYFYQVNAIAGYLIVPYCLWSGLATLLNYTIWKYNRPESQKSNRKSK